MRALAFMTSGLLLTFGLVALVPAASAWYVVGHSDHVSCQEDTPDSEDPIGIGYVGVGVGCHWCEVRNSNNDCVYYGGGESAVCVFYLNTQLCTPELE